MVVVGEPGNEEGTDEGGERMQSAVLLHRCLKPCSCYLDTLTPVCVSLTATHESVLAPEI